MSHSPEETAAIPRNVRVDRIGFVTELVDQFQKPLIEKVKAAMKAGDRSRGDFFASLLTETSKTEINAEAFLRLFEKKLISRDQFLSAISISVSRTQQLLSEKDLQKVATKYPGSSSLRITRIKGVQIQLVDAVKDLSAQILAAAV